MKRLGLKRLKSGGLSKGFWGSQPSLVTDQATESFQVTILSYFLFQSIINSTSHNSFSLYLTIHVFLALPLDLRGRVKRKS